MDTQQLQRHKFRNGLQAVLLLGGMAVLLMVVGWVLAGTIGIWVAALGTLILAGGQRVSPQMLFRMYRARRLTPAEAPTLFRVIEVLAQRAALPVLPSLYYIPSAMLNAFTVGQLPNVAIGVTDGLLRRLTQRELVGVLAHEMSHIVHRDTWVMGLADVVSRTTSLCANAGQLLLIISIPSMLLSAYSPPWLLILILLSAPTLSALLQLALSRTREFDADLEAVRLIGDADGLAAALARLVRYQHGFLERLLMPGRRLPDPTLLRTHPTTEERIERLQTLTGEHHRPRHAPMPVEAGFVPMATHIPHVIRVPRWRPGGLWY